MRIWLDDVRTPPSTEWEWCKNHMEFLDALWYVTEIEHVAFDHDLGDNSKDGSWCAGVLAKVCLEHEHLPTYSCHSDNPDGKKNILSKMDSLASLLRKE